MCEVTVEERAPEARLRVMRPRGPGGGVKGEVPVYFVRSSVANKPAFEDMNNNVNNAVRREALSSSLVVFVVGLYARHEARGLSPF